AVGAGVVANLHGPGIDGDGAQDVAAGVDQRQRSAAGFGDGHAAADPAAAAEGVVAARVDGHKRRRDVLCDVDADRARAGGQVVEQDAVRRRVGREVFLVGGHGSGVDQRPVVSRVDVPVVVGGDAVVQAGPSRRVVGIEDQIEGGVGGVVDQVRVHPRRKLLEGKAGEAGAGAGDGAGV